MPELQATEFFLHGYRDPCAACRRQSGWHSPAPLRRQAVCTGWIGGEPGARRVDHGIGSHDGIAPIYDVDFEWRLFSPGSLHLVEADPGDRTFPTKIDLAKISNRQFTSILQAYNATPRKCLHFRTPAELFRQQLLHVNPQLTLGGNDGD